MTTISLHNQGKETGCSLKSSKLKYDQNYRRNYKDFGIHLPKNINKHTTLNSG